MIRQGEKYRILTVTLGGEAAPVETNAPPVDREASPPIAAYVTGAVGVAALGVALYLALDANADARNLRDTCAPTCEQTAVDDIDNQRLVAGVTAGLGGAAVIAAAVLFLTHDRGRSPSTASRFLPGLRPLAGGGIISTGARF